MKDFLLNAFVVLGYSVFAGFGLVLGGALASVVFDIGLHVRRRTSNDPR